MNKALAAVAALALVGGAIGLGVALDASDPVVTGDKILVTMLIKDSKGDYSYRERVGSTGGDFKESLQPGEQLVELVKALPCDGGQSARCAAGDDRAAVSPCVIATGPDCFRKSPADKAPRFIGLNAVFYATEASGTQCKPAQCTVVSGDTLK